MPNNVRLLVCGGRFFKDRDLLFVTLDAFMVSHEIEIVIEGEAPGADRLAREWAEARGIPVDRYHAHWESFGRAAGPIRNQKMLDEGKPTYAFAFYDRPRHQSKGTADMVRKLKRAGITVEEIGP